MSGSLFPVLGKLNYLNHASLFTAHAKVPMPGTRPVAIPGKGYNESGYICQSRIWQNGLYNGNESGYILFIQ
jgi:hypothetical protein